MEKEAKHVCSALDVRSKSNTQLVLESINLTHSIRTFPVPEILDTKGSHKHPVRAQGHAFTLCMRGTMRQPVYAAYLAQDQVAYKP
eukprot:1160273-Pelagomonas_calceolata.AAC.12